MTPRGRRRPLDPAPFYGTGFRRRAADVMGQVGRYTDGSRPPLAFEADHRQRVFLAPLRRRIGHLTPPGADAAGVR